MSELERADTLQQHPDSGLGRELNGPHADAGRGRPYRTSVCGKCGANEHVHRGLCRRCRRMLSGEGRIVPTDGVRKPLAASPEPLHNPPWRRRGA